MCNKLCLYFLLGLIFFIKNVWLILRFCFAYQLISKLAGRLGDFGILGDFERLYWLCFFWRGAIRSLMLFDLF